MPKKVREDLKPRPLAVAEKMLPYANRIKLRANEPAGSAQLEAIKVMADILDKKKIHPSKAAQAIREARNAAAPHQLALARFKSDRDAAANALKDLDDLILKMAELATAISILPTISKGHLNRKTADLVKKGVFDTELFFDLINLILTFSREVSPQKDADDSRRIIEPREGESSPQILKLWESIPAITRSCVEGRIRSSRVRSGVELLRMLPKLLRKSRPTHRRGAPRFLLREYVKDIDRIWHRLNLTGRRQYDSVKDRHVQSLFQKFCNAALNSVGDPTEISIRQVLNLKRGAPPKRKPRSSS